MYLQNQIVLDGKVQKDVKIFDDIVNFNLSSITGKYISPNNEEKSRYTFIRVIYDGEVTDKIKQILQPGNFIRMYGKLDSEQYQSKTGKIVYNKILVAEKINQLKYDPEFGIFTEVM